MTGAGRRDGSVARRARTVLVALGLVVGVTGLATATGAAPAAANPAPTPTPARVGKPASIAALGDSITQSTGTGQLGEENPKNSWSTGWEVSSVAERIGIPRADRQNLSANGARMGDADAQVVNGRDGQSLRPTTEYVTIEMGGNDLCRDSVADMTSVSTYRTQLRQALAAIAGRAPQALVFVMSVPDIYNLWYIRGAPRHSTYHPEPESDQAGGLNGARFYWGQSFFPCQSLLTNPDSYSAGDRARREQVRQRTLDYNAALAAECGQWLRCRYDDDRLFDLTSNRANPPHGPLLPHSQWVFTDGDISRNEGAGTWLCPVQGVFAGGCGDHFHPSKSGQQKLAQVADTSSYQWSDTTPPTADMSATPAPRPDGTRRGPVTVTFSGTDAAGLRGQEVRVHHPNGTVTPWSPSIGVHPPITVTELGVTHVEVRSLDVNGNQSASRVLSLTLSHTAPAAPGVPQPTTGDGEVDLTWTAPADDGGSPVTGYQVQVRDPADGTTTVATGAGRSATVAVPNGRVAVFRVRAVSSVGAGAWSGWSTATLAPFAAPVDLVDRTYDDLALRPPTPAERTVTVDAMVTGASTPAEEVAGLTLGAAWEPVLSPVVRLYRAYFLRFPEGAGLAYWEGRHRDDLSVNAMSRIFATTPEFRQRYGSLDDREFVQLVYVNVLGRQPEPAGWDYWVEELRSGRFTRGRMMTFYSESIENRERTRTTVLPIVTWWGLLGRVPTPAERTTATATLTAGTLADLVEDVFATDEWVARVT